MGPIPTSVVAILFQHEASQMLKALKVTINLEMSSAPPWQSPLSLPKPHTGLTAAWCHPGHLLSLPNSFFPLGHL